MDAGMSTEKFLRIITSLKEAKSIASDMVLSPDAQTSAQKIHLLRLLDRIQHLVVSLRTDFIDLFYFRGPPDAEYAATSESETPAAMDFGEAAAERRPNVVSFNRRRAKDERRQMHTFIARDRRSGIADRRRRSQPRPDPIHGLSAGH
jgi:hypothetical protein